MYQCANTPTFMRNKIKGKSLLPNFNIPSALNHQIKLPLNLIKPIIY